MSPMLERMEKERVFSIMKTRDGNFEIEEECDNYFGADLTADELRQLGQEIVALADGAT